MDISSSDGSNSIPGGLVRTISGMKGVKYVYGRQSCLGVPAEVMGDTTVYGAVDIISFDDFDLDCLKKDRALTRGSSLSKVYGNSGHVLAAWDQNSPLRIGDRILVAGSELEIAGLLKYDPFSSDGLTNGKITLITSRDTFTRLTDVEDYSLIMIQTTGDATDEDIKALGREMCIRDSSIPYIYPWRQWCCPRPDLRIYKRSMGGKPSRRIYKDCLLYTSYRR